MSESAVQFSGESAELTLLVTCSNRKRAALGTGPRFRDLAERCTGEEPREAWTRRLSDAGSTAPAREVYVGGQWSLIRGLAAVPGVDLWVCSAGYGLLPGDAEITPYSATFSPGHPDTVRDLGGWGWGSEASARWWRELAEWEGPASGCPRTLSELVTEVATRPVLAVLSPPYLRVLKRDLCKVRRDIGEEHLVVLSVGSRPDPELGGSLMDVDGTLVTVLGGVLGTAAVRAANYIVHKAGPAGVSASSATGLLRDLLRSSSPLPRYKRRQGSDEEVTAWIRKELQLGHASRGTLLRRFRDSGLACEQNRFGRLFEAAQVAER